MENVAKKDSDIYKAFMIFRYTGAHVSVLCESKYDLREETDDDGDILIIWKRPKKKGGWARTHILKHQNIKFNISDYAQSVYKRRKKNNRMYFYRKMKELGEEAGVSEVTPNSLRHSLAVQLLNDNYPEVTVAQIMNVSPKTMKFYGRFTDRGIKDKLKGSGW